MTDPTYVAKSLGDAGGDDSPEPVETNEDKCLINGPVSFNTSSEICGSNQAIQCDSCKNVPSVVKNIKQTNEDSHKKVLSEMEYACDSTFGSPFIVRDEILLLDPATDLETADSELCLEKSSDYKTSYDATNGENKLIEECEHIFQLCENSNGVTSMQDLMKMNLMLTDVIAKIETSHPGWDSLNHSVANGNEPFNGESSAQSESWSPEQTTCLIQHDDVQQAVETNGSIRSSESHICSLPVELLHKVFSYLTNKELCTTVAPVCKLWLDLAYDPIHWQKLDSSLIGSLTEEEFCRLIDRCQCLRHFSTSHRDDLSSFEIIYLVEHCHLLKSLDLRFSRHVDAHVLEKIVNNCKELELLNIEGIRFSDGNAVSGLLCKLTKLKSLNVSDCNLFDDEAIILLSQNLPHLTEINIAYIPWITDIAVKELVKAYHEQLESIILDGDQLTDASTEVLSQCPRLKRLHILFCEEMTDKTLMYVKTMSNLVDLKLTNGSQFSDAALEKTFSCSNLSHLQHLDLSQCSLLEDDGVIMMSKCCGASLEELELCWCWDITDVGLKAIIKYCRKLLKLNLTGLMKITGCDLPDIPLNMPNLLALDLTECGNIDDQLALQLAIARPQLTVLNYYKNNILYDHDFL